jgi:hypothetical protein
MAAADQQWDTSKLPQLVPGQYLYRHVDDDDVKGWDENEKRWVIDPAALDKKALTPSAASGYGLSVFVEEYLSLRCGAEAGREIVLLQSHAAQHGCAPTWERGIVVRINVKDLLAHRFGVGGTPGDCACPEVKDAHASIWTEPGWTRKERNDFLKVMGKDYVYEHPRWTHERLAASPSKPPTP